MIVFLTISTFHNCGCYVNILMQSDAIFCFLYLGGPQTFQTSVKMLNALTHPAVNRLVNSDEPAVIAYHQYSLLLMHKTSHLLMHLLSFVFHEADAR